MDRRTFLQLGAAAGAATALGPGFWQRAIASAAAPRIAAGSSPYGRLLPADENGLMLPKGFSSRIVARAEQPVGATTYPWHPFPDGGATFARPDGGWVYVCNSEVPAAGGASAVAFGPDGEIVDAYRVLAGTSMNCAGGPTPWGTWLSCEEHDLGRVWECDPTGANPTGTVHPALGTFAHEAVAVDHVGGVLYLTEDRPDGRFYRFVPHAYPLLAAGALQVAVVAADGRVTWRDVPDPTATVDGPTRYQVPESTPFDGGEGVWFDSGHVYFTTKGDNRVWDYLTARRRLMVLYDGSTPDAPLQGPDNITVTPGGDMYVCEDGGNMEICVVTPQRRVGPFLRVVDHVQSEVTGVAFDPSGTRMYFSSQRGEGKGVTYEVRGPFRRPTRAGTVAS